MKLELYYIDHMSLKLDIKIFFMTFIKVFIGDGDGGSNIASEWFDFGFIDIIAHC